MAFYPNFKQQLERNPCSDNKKYFDLGSFLKCGAVIGMDFHNDLVFIGVSPSSIAMPKSPGAHFYAPDFFLKEKNPWYLFENTFIFNKLELKEMLLSYPLRQWDINRENLPSQDIFSSAFKAAMDGFSKKKWDKVVPYCTSSIEASTGPSQIAWALLRILDLPPGLAPYGLWEPHCGIIGATPELLFKKKGLEVTSMAVAGTRRIDSHQMSLLDDPKQLEEHRLVVSGLRSALERFGNALQRPIHVKKLVFLEHLCTEIFVLLKSDVSFEELVLALHPTPALGASPRGSADKFFDDLEAVVPRHRFGAPLGLSLLNGDAICVAAIRNAQWHDDKITLAAGCGIIPASRFEDEWAELNSKIKSIRRILGL